MSPLPCWFDWINSTRDLLLIIVSITVGIDAIATGALIDMHTLKT